MSIVSSIPTTEPSLMTQLGTTLMVRKVVRPRRSHLLHAPAGEFIAVGPHSGNRRSHSI